MRRRSFSEWKTTLMNRLIRLYSELEGEEKAQKDLDILITKLQYLKLRDLSSFLSLLHIVIKAHGLKELVNYLPTEEEIYGWFGRER